MAQQYVHTDYLTVFQTIEQHITYVTTRPPVYPAPGVPSMLPDLDQQVQTQQSEPAVNLDELIRKRREKARRMRQR